jgi:L-rhamnose isomerase
MCFGTCPGSMADVPAIQAMEKKYGVKAGAINPNLFQDADYKYGSIANPSTEIRAMALQHVLDSAEIGKQLGSKDVSLWIADGSNYPGTQSMRERIGWMEEVLGATHAVLADGQRMLVEYKPFEPDFYHTDIADWGMALELSQRPGPKAKVLVDIPAMTNVVYLQPRTVSAASDGTPFGILSNPAQRCRYPDRRPAEVARHARISTTQQYGGLLRRIKGGRTARL